MIVLKMKVESLKLNVSNDRCGVRDIGDIEAASEAVEVKYLPLYSG